MDEIGKIELSRMYVVWEVLTFIVLVQNAVDPVEMISNSHVESETLVLITV